MARVAFASWREEDSLILIRVWLSSSGGGSWLLVVCDCDGFLDVQVPHIQCVIFDEFSARFDGVTHKDGKDVVSFHCVVNPHL